MIPDYSNSEALNPDTIQGVYIDSLGTNRDTVDYFFIIKPQKHYRVRDYNLGGGIKYLPFKHLMINVALISKWVDVRKASDGEEKFFTDIYYRFNGDSLRQIPLEYNRRLYFGLGIKFGINLPFDFGRFIRINPGIEAEWYFKHFDSQVLSPIEIYYSGTDYAIYCNTQIGIKNMDNIFTLNLGLEFRPQPRLGFSLIGKFRFYHEYKNSISIYGLYQDRIDGGNMVPFHITDYVEYFKFFGETYTINFAVSLYF